MYVLIFNAILYFGTMMYVYKQDRCFSIRVLLLAIYFFFALMGIITVQNGIFFDTFGFYSLSNISLLPFLFNYLMILALVNILKHNTIYQQFNICFDTIAKIPPKKIQIFETIVVSLCIVLLLLGIYGAIKTTNMSLGEIYRSIRLGERESFIENRFLNFVFVKLDKALIFLTPFVCILELCMYISSKSRRNKSIYIIAFMFFCLTFKYFVTANRGGIFFAALYFVFFLWLSWRHLNHKIKKYIIWLAMLGGVTISYFMLQISESRFEDNSSQNNIRYLGEVFPNLGLRIWPIPGEHLMFERKFPDIYSLLGGEIRKFDSRETMIAYYETKSRFPVNNFKSFFGDLYIEYGVLLSFIIFLFTLVVLKYLINKYKYTGLSIIFLFVTYKITVWGLYGCKLDEESFKHCILYIIALLYIKYQLLYKTNYVR